MEETPIKRQRYDFKLLIANSTKTYILFLKYYDSLFMTLNDITRWLNLTDVNISNNKIDLLPRKLGALYLRRLNLSHNCLRRFGWTWLKEARIKRTLRFLDISNNSVRHCKILRQSLIKAVLS